MADQQLAELIARQITAVNAHDTDAITALFAPDAYISDNGREFRGTEAVRGWVEREVVAGKVTMEVRETTEHYGDMIVCAAYDGDFDRTGLPPEVVLTNYYAVRAGRIVSLVISFGGPAPAAG